MQTISEDDYFVRSSEFSHWLRHSRKCELSELSSKESRKQFSKFVRKWNNGKLKSNFYDFENKVDTRARDNTAFKWNLKGVDDAELQKLVDEVAFTSTKKQEKNRTTEGRSHIGISSRSRDPLPANPYDQVKAEQDRDDQYKLKRKLQKDYKKTNSMVEEELVPKESGKQAIQEKKRAKRESLRKDDDNEVEVSESDLMGGGNSFEAAMARNSNPRHDRRAEAKLIDQQKKTEMIQEKVGAYKEREAKTMNMLKELAARRK